MSSVTASSSSSNTPHLAFTTISNVKLHVPVLLSFSEPNYKKWSRLFLLLVRRFSLAGFLTGTTVPKDAADAEWFQLDALIQGWILSTINDEVSDMILTSANTAAALWKATHDLFHDNKQARAMELEHQFRTTIKGTATMAAYCQTLKNVADWLDDVDAPVSESQLVLQLLRGLPDDLRAQTTFLQFQTPPPTFMQARSTLLLLDRQRISLDADNSNSGTALVTPHASNTGHTSGIFPGRGQSYGSSGRNRGRGQHNRGRGRGRSTGSQRLTPETSYWQPPYPNPHPHPGLLGPRPSHTPHTPPYSPQAYYAQPYQTPNPGTYNYTHPPSSYPAHPHPYQTNPGSSNPTPSALAHNFDTLSLREPTWLLDTGASHHIASNPGTLSHVRPQSLNSPSFITVGNGSKVRTTATGHFTFNTDPPLTLNNVLISPHIIHNLISVRQFTRDNHCTIEFDPTGFSVKDIQTGKVIHRSSNNGPLYPMCPPTAQAQVATVNLDTWHRRLGHPSPAVLRAIPSFSSLLSQPSNHSLHKLCHACQLGKHVRLPFTLSRRLSTFPFQLLHTDLWQSPIPSVSGFKYYMFLLDDYSHYLWVFPLRHKSDAYSKIQIFLAYVKNHFNITPKSVQCDNGTEYSQYTPSHII